MPRSSLASLLFALALALASAASLASLASLAACAEESQTAPTVSAPTAPTATVSPGASPSASPSATTAPSGSAAAPSPSAEEGAPDASAPSQAGPGTPLGAVDGGAPAQFRACTMDSDCVAVPRAGCCRNGWMEAVAVSQKDAYARAGKCAEPHPICPMYIVQDKRVALCDNATHLCTMTPPEQVACGGFIRNQHQCPAGYQCRMSKVPDVGGKCVKQP
jgi:hypothetical protein